MLWYITIKFDPRYDDRNWEEGTAEKFEKIIGGYLPMWNGYTLELTADESDYPDARIDELLHMYCEQEITPNAEVTYQSEYQTEFGAEYWDFTKDKDWAKKETWDINFVMDWYSGIYGPSLDEHLDNVSVGNADPKIIAQFDEMIEEQQKSHIKWCKEQTN